MRFNRLTIIIAALAICIFSVSVFWVYEKQSGNSAPASQGSNSAAPSSGGFVFDVEADPHIDDNSDPVVFKQTLANIVKDKPSFLIDLGDIFMIDKLPDKREDNIRERYVMMKGYYDLLGSIPLYFAMGNHDGETGWDPLNTRNYRKTYFPDQTSDRNYYTFEKGDALFVILDPFCYTTQKPDNDGWKWTLGKEQYDWLKATLEESRAKYKFVFIHQLVGGDNQGRGGVEMAGYYEWGGKNPDGKDGFDANRPGWGKPIQQILVDNKVNIVFKGHDHFFARQQLDGIVYQTLPQPSHPGDKITTAVEYGYTTGDIIGGSGHLRVTVQSTGVEVEFVLADDSRDVANQYSLN